MSMRIAMAITAALCVGGCGDSKSGDGGEAGGTTSSTDAGSSGDDGTAADAGTGEASTTSGGGDTSGDGSTSGAGDETTGGPPPEECGEPYFYDAACGDCQTDGLCADGSPCFQTMYDGQTWGGCAPQCGGLTMCPDAPSGTAQPTCRQDPNFDAVCVLQCTTAGEQAECPDDMTCVVATVPDYGTICAFTP